MKIWGVFFLSCLSFIRMDAQERIIVSDNPRFNAIIKGFTGFLSVPTGHYQSVQIEKANLVNGIYRNVVRLWYGKGKNDYINLLYNTYPTEDAACNGLKSENYNNGNVLLIDWDSIQGTSKNIILSGTKFRTEPYNNGFKASQSRIIRRVSPPRSHKESIFDLSFEGISLLGSNRLEGVDAETGLNANYYNQEERTITFQGTEGKAWAEIVKAPRRKGKALHFIAVQRNEGGLNDGKLRVTGSVNGLKAVAVVNSVDIYIPCSWKALTKIESPITWLTVQEYWCSSAGKPVGGEPQFRMTLGILKKAGRSESLFFNLKAQDLETIQLADGSRKENYTTLYELDDYKSKKFKIPFGRWFNLRTELIAGDCKNGHFRLVATDYKGHETVVFDEACQTAASGYFEPGANQPFYKAVSPLKLYASARMLKYMRGKPLDIYFDNWKYKATCVSEDDPLCFHN